MTFIFAYTFGGQPGSGMDFSRRRKQFVEVIAEHKLDGSTIPKTILPADGRRFDIEMARDPVVTEMSTSGVPLTVYSISAKGEETCLFEDGGRWYVMMKT